MNTVTLYGALEQVRVSLSEIFYSIQGEGKYLGMPTIFFRFNKCNIRCNYCDTDFEKIGFDNFDSMIEKITSIIRNNPVRHVCFTGGEPLLFKDHINAILELLEEEYGSEVFVTSATGNNVLIYPLREWEAIERKLMEGARMQSAKQKFLRNTSYFGQEAKIDSQGRVLIRPFIPSPAHVPKK